MIQCEEVTTGRKGINSGVEDAENQISDMALAGLARWLEHQSAH